MTRLPRVLGLAFVTVLFVSAAALSGADRPVLRARAPALSPDGSRIAFSYRGDIWVVPRAGGRARRLTNHPAYDSGCAWSPDGKRIAFNSIRHDHYDVFVVDAEGGTPRRITRHSGYDLIEDWYDGETLLIRTSRRGSSDLALAPLDGSTPRLLTHTPMDAEMYASVVPGGDLVLLSDKSAYSYRRIRFHGSAASDIWVLRIRGEGPRWRCLVDSGFCDVHPKAAPDGTVWFVSNRSGTPNLWTVPLAGGKPKQRTRLEGRGLRRPSFSRDGRWAAFDHGNRIHLMATADGKPRPVDILVGAEPAHNPVEHRTFTSGADEFDISPDGKLMAVVVHGEIFVAPAGESALARNVSRSVGRETQVAWGPDSRTLYFISDRDGNREVYRADLVQGTTERLTNTPDNEAWPMPSPDGKRLVYLVGTTGMKIVPEVPGPRRRAILDRARRFADLDTMAIDDEFEEGEVESLAALADVIAQGEDAPPDLGAREVPFLIRAMGASDPESVDGQKRIERVNVVLKAVTGYPMPSPTPGSHGADKFRQVALHWAIYHGDRCDPDDDIVFKAPEGFKVRAIADPVEPEKARMVPAHIADMALWSGRAYDWSPDSRWLAFTERGPGYQTDLRILDTRDGAVREVTEHPSSGHPRFSADGAWLSFVSNFPEDNDVFLLRLTTPKRTFPGDPLRDVLEEGGESEKKKPSKGPAPVEIDFERITDRVVQATGYPAHEGNALLSPDGKTVFFTSGMGDTSELYSLPAPHVDGPRRLKQLTHGEKPSSVRLSGDGKRLFYLSSGRVRSISLSGAGGKTHGFRAEMEIDRQAELSYVLDEALWLLGTWFYDPDHHGADWDEIARRYRGLLGDASPGIDFDSMLDDLCAELEASHVGASGGDTGGESEPPTGHLGIDLDDDALADGRTVLTSVLEGGPADHAEVALKSGDIILAVNGAETGRGVNVHALLRGTVGRRVELGVKTGDAERTVVIQPCSASDERDLRYERWVRERRAKVDEWSGGRLAYLHIRSMNTEPLNRFRREILIETKGKAGAIIDVRYNGGGWTAVHILDALSRRPFVMRSFRHGTRVSENRYRDRGLEIPLVAMTNHASFSNAEIFSEGFSRLGLGPVVGVPTAGGVIGTGSFKLLNGMRLRRPSWAAWTVDGENLEGNGRPVTHRVENAPGRAGHEEDRQLGKAVELLLP
jgi:Tol biopolymer transport system component/C-terminal processing protease CtpA/Prc